ncbi:MULTISPECIES: hypothetical protein [unclassified Streptomyces]|uniref:hypothetical protein n=1 Tax=unclassified Streptomyces TaxID=2593676 RepID=UPI00331DF530
MAPGYLGMDAEPAASLRGNEVGAKVVDPGAVDFQGSRHPGSNVRGTVEVLHWFRQLR